MPIKNQAELLAALIEVVDYVKKQMPEVQLAATLPEVASNSDFDVLKSLLMSDEWPVAVPEYLICSDSEQDKIERADGVLDLLSLDLEGKKVLDFGCGEGHLVYEMVKKANFAIGYDLVKSGDLTWEDNLTTDWQKVKEGGPYDIVILFDVLDHCQNPVAVLEQLRDVCTTETQIHCRFHPWMGPHAAHYYKTLNKAYIHLVFTDDELRQLGIEPNFLQKVYLPMRDQDQWIKSAGFASTRHEIQNVDVSSFFKDNALVKSRLPLTQFNNAFPEFQMSQVFHDYVLKMLPRDK